MPSSLQKFGGAGEQQAADYLKRLGYRIVECNFRTRMGEIDIIAMDQDTLVFVEVKTRMSLAFGSPKNAVTFQKQRRISKAALFYLKMTHQSQVRARFDVVAITSGPSSDVIELIKNAFTLSAY